MRAQAYRDSNSPHVGDARFPSNELCRYLARRSFLIGAILLTALLSFEAQQACAADRQLLLTPNTVQFGKVNLDTSTSMPVTLKNIGNAPIIISSEKFRASASITMSGFKLPVTLSVGQSLTFVIKFAPTVVGAQSGYVLFLSNAAHIGFSLVIDGSGVQPSVSAVPTSASFGSVPVGASTSQTIQVKNAGTTPLTISGATASGTGFSVSGPTLPVALSAGTAATLTIKFSPKSAGAVSGVATVTGGFSSLSILSASATTENFGNVTLGSSATATVNLKNTGNSNVTISKVSSAGTGISASGAADVILSPGQATALTVKFAPTKAGAVTGSVTVASNASNSPVTIAVSGGGVAPPSTYSVNLSWAPSASSGVSRYDVYRSTVSGGPYTQIGSASTVDYTDSSVQANTEYFYVITSVDAGVQSGYSSQIAVSIP